VLIARWLGDPPSRGQCFVLSPASLSLLGQEHGHPAILGLNRIRD
jgi:hypothetical protein